MPTLSDDQPVMPLPTTPTEADAFVAAVMAEPETMAHGDMPGMAMEHMRLLDLVERSAATHVAIADGDWFDAATWHEGRIPGPGAQALIPRGVQVTYDGVSDASLSTLRIDGDLCFATDADTRMVIDTFVVSPSGRLEIGTAETPVQANVSTEIVIANNGDIDTAWDPTLLSRGVISHGSVEIHGADKSSFLKVGTTPMAGDRQITLEEAPEGWQVGDTLVLTGTHKQGWGWDNDLRRVVHRESEDEEITITAIDGNRITIDRPLEHDHDTPRADLAAYVSNMSRNITIRSEDGAASEVHHRGHVMFMHSDDVDVRYAAFDDLGRTDKSVPAADVGTFSSIAADSNVKGRYSVHLHKTGTEDQENPAFLVGNAVSGSPGWGITHHSSHAVIVENAVFDAFGAAFAAEDGDETGVWARNIAIGSEGFAWGEASAKLQSDLPRHDNGRTGDGFFFAGRLVEATENVAANTTHGFVWMHRSAPSSPLSANLDHPEIAYGDDTMRLDQAPIQGFRDNEAFGTQVGAIVIKADSRQEHDVRTVMDGFLNWETYAGMDLTYTSHYTVKDVDLIGARNAAAEFGFRLGGNAFDMVVNGMQIEGFNRGVDLTTNMFTFPVTNADVGHVFIDVDQTGVGAEYVGFDAARHRVMSSDELAEGRLDFAMTGDLTLSPDETLFFNGMKTDSIGSRARQFTSVDDIQSASFQENIVPLLQSQGYYTAEDGRHILFVEDFIADRATGELLKFAHEVTLAMTDTQLAALGAANNGAVTLGGAAPIGVADTATVAPGEAVVIDVLANDRDPEGGTIRVDGMTQPEQGGTLMGPNGAILYVAGIDVSGTDAFSYWVADTSGNFTRTEVTVTIDADQPPAPPPDPNTAPVARDDTLTATLTGGQAFIDPAALRANDSDADGDLFSISGLTGLIWDDGLLRVTAPVTDGQASAGYTISDGNGGTDSANVTVNVPAPPPDPNTAPVARDDTLTATLTGGQAFIDPAALRANDSDADGDLFSISGLTGLVWDDGLLRVTAPVTDGQASAGYTISDGNGGTDSANVTVNVPAPPPDPNTAPVARDDTLTATLTGGQAFIDPAALRANDSDADGDLFSISGLTGLVWDDGLRVTAPVTDGQASAGYTISDGNGGTDSANVTVNVPAPPPDPELGSNGISAAFFSFDGGVSSLADIDWSATPDAVQSVESIDYWNTGAFWENGPEDFFAARFEGDLRIQTSGMYTFYLTSDDGSALSIDGNTVIDNDGQHGPLEQSATVFLEAGSHPLDVRYFEAAGEQVLSLEWAGPDTNGSRTLLTEENTGTPQPLQDVLETNEISAAFFSFDGGVSSLADIDWSATPDAVQSVESIDYWNTGAFWENGPEDFFAARFEGDLRIQTSGMYTFYLTSDDGSALSIDGNTVIDNDGQHGPLEQSATVFLEAGSHPLDVRYFEAAGEQVLSLEWAGPDTNGSRTLLTEENTGTPQPLQDVLETGTLSLDHKATTVTLQQSYENPVVIAHVATENGAQPVNVRVSGVSGNDLSLQLQEPNYLDGSHVNETVNYMVVEAGTWMLPDGTVFEAGTMNSNKLSSQGFESVAFDAGFDSAPVILSQVQTFNDGDFVTTRQQDADADGFQLTMQEEEALNGDTHMTETLGWIAMETGSGVAGDVNWQAGSTSGVNHGHATVGLGASMAGGANVIAALSSFDGSNTAWARGNGGTSSTFDVSVEEETSQDAETGHIAETVDYFVFNDAGVVGAYDYDFFV